MLEVRHHLQVEYRERPIGRSVPILRNKRRGKVPKQQGRIGGGRTASRGWERR